MAPGDFHTLASRCRRRCRRHGSRGDARAVAIVERRHRRRRSRHRRRAPRSSAVGESTTISFRSGAIDSDDVELDVALSSSVFVQLR